MSGTPRYDEGAGHKARAPPLGPAAAHYSVTVISIAASDGLTIVMFPVALPIAVMRVLAPDARMNRSR